MLDTLSMNEPLILTGVEEPTVDVAGVMPLIEEAWIGTAAEDDPLEALPVVHCAYKVTFELNV
jgi:hypothetical protein